jgi:predicted TIM-barrel fold metal-dependent hydrolase
LTKNSRDLKRRDFFKYSTFGLTGATLVGMAPACEAAGRRAGGLAQNPSLAQKVQETPLIDTHEHLMNESERLQAGEKVWDKANDWTFLLSHYFDSDLVVAGMSQADHDRFFSPGLGPLEKWKLVEPFWPSARYTGYGLNVRQTLRMVYGINDLSAESVKNLQTAYRETIKPGFYRHLLRDVGNIESCQVNLWPFLESEQPDLLKSDLHISGMIEEDWDPEFARKAGIAVKSLDDWHRVIDYWITTYGKKAVAVKSTMAYQRDLDCVPTPAEAAEKPFLKKLHKEPMTPEERKALEDHLFWYTVGRATEMGLPVKLHTGYHAGHGQMPLRRVRGNPSAVCDLCRHSPQTRFVLFHVSYPYYEEMLAVAKQYPNAYMDMCWSWIINPLAAKDFLKKFLVTAPANKIFTFGGDYIPVELVPGHAAIARQGIGQALSELVDEKWLTLNEASKLADLIMHQNASTFYKL